MMPSLPPVPSRLVLAQGARSRAIVPVWESLLSALLLVLGTAWAGPLEVPGPDAMGWLRLRSSDATNRVQTLQASDDLRAWSEAGVFHGGSFEFSDPTAPSRKARFYRVATRPRTSADDGRNQLRAEADPFLVRPMAGLFETPIHWAKFTVLREDPTRVWFQDSQRYPFHHDYARVRLKPFLGMGRAEFDLRTLYPSNHQAVLGAVLVPGDGRPEYGIQIVGLQPWPRDEVLQWLRLVRAAVRVPVGTQAWYLPTPEQAAAAEADREVFAAAGFPVGSVERWLSQDAVYSEGWAVGRLAWVPAAEIPAARADGRLRSTDILLTDRVPAELPPLAGILTLSPSTPNSHVALLAQGDGIPFVWFADAAERERLRGLAGREIALRTQRGFGTTATVLDLGPGLTGTLREELLALKRPRPLSYVPRQLLGSITNLAPLSPGDVRWVGGKAAHYGLLRVAVPSNSQPAIALTFDLWEQFLSQTLPSGRTLRAEIDIQLSGLDRNAEIPGLAPRLEVIRRTITREARFSPAQQAAILGALANAGFDPRRKVRFRSSTNVEDGEEFTGAGLYDSFSGCLSDDLDADVSGPCSCDPSEPEERGVFRAIQRVYASFYNDNAFLERWRRGVVESEVGMALLVHHSFPDEIEMANGVATVTWDASFGSVSFDGKLVTQLGAESVTNPDGATRPEVVDFYQSWGSLALALRQSSSRVPVGGQVMPWEGDYRRLVGLLESVAKEYARRNPSRKRFALDFEYKRVQPGRLELKQVRPLPLADAPASPVTTFLMPTDETFVVQEGEFSSVFAKHRLKCRLRLVTEARRLTAAGLASPPFAAAAWDASHLGSGWFLTNGFAGWPGFVHSVSEDRTRDVWVAGSGGQRRTLALVIDWRRSARPPDSAWVTLLDGSLRLEATYATPQPELTWEGPGTATNETVLLVPLRPPGPGVLPQTRKLTHPGGLAIDTRFLWPPEPRGPTAGYTAPNLGFVETRITGLTREPLVLRSAASQTYSPGHHNFTETFLFEPALDPGTTPAQVAELEAAGIRQLVVDDDLLGGKAFWVVGPGGKLRRF
ncbi:MAG: PEP/pyruvate-binding domain-containing protein [Verrucomicrobiota bacterium]